ncbi:hypothetical protein IFO66_11850 [Paenibacillus sp. CAU 1523]|uniref:Uncharacterized protein n=1 Tax=Paenibacillus arenosi TaxID=2774142 RepID=A0ABR9AZ75_9BACL|nr:hypothetical protein [Paenibacillus arenosi]MBD8498998.1 hypothetical protein [Paenibacillus arenosi]
MNHVKQSSMVADQDFVIEHVKEKFSCTVLSCEGRPCLEYKTEEELTQISEYVQAVFQREVTDVFFAAVSSVDAD